MEAELNLESLITESARPSITESFMFIGRPLLLLTNGPFKLIALSPSKKSTPVTSDLVKEFPVASSYLAPPIPSAKSSLPPCSWFTPNSLIRVSSRITQELRQLY